MKHLLHKWRDLDPATAPTYDAEPAVIMAAVRSFVDRAGWFCGTIAERTAGGYRAAVWAGFDPVLWVFGSWCTQEHDAMLEAFIQAMEVDRERYGEPVAVESMDKPEDYV